MAQYRLETIPISRSKGRPATAAAAYQSADQIVDQRLGKTYTYHKKKGVFFSEVITPDSSPIARQELWNLAEAAEKRKDARTAREWILNLPYELNKEQQIELTRSFAKYLVDTYQIAVDFSLHEPPKNGDQRNFHAHILTTTRQWKSGKLTEKSTFELNDTHRKERGLGRSTDELTAIREVVENLTNEALQKAQIDTRVTSKSLRARGIIRRPTRHLGPRFTALERKGIKTHRGNYNRNLNFIEEEKEKIDFFNSEIKAIEAELEAILAIKNQKNDTQVYDLKKIFSFEPEPEQTPTTQIRQIKQSKESIALRRLYLLHYNRIAKNVDLKTISPSRLDLYIAARLKVTGHDAKEIRDAIYFIRRRHYQDKAAKEYATAIAGQIMKNNLVLSTIKDNLLAIEKQPCPAKKDQFLQYQHPELLNLNQNKKILHHGQTQTTRRRMGR